MKLAIAFDDLIQFGGAERLLVSVCGLYPNTPVYTSVASAEWLKRCKNLGIEVKTSFMHRLPWRIKLNRLYGLMGIHAMAFESFNFADYDVVLSISARYAHCVLTRPKTVHICYMNSPGRMFWEPVDYFSKEGLFSGLIGRFAYSYVVQPLLTLRRVADYTSAQRVDYFIANSESVKKKIAKYYRKNSQVVYPFFKPLDKYPAASDDKYFLVITRLAAWKRVDLAIEACKNLGHKLTIIGDGPDVARLRGLSDHNLQFLGFVTDAEKSRQIAGCKALIVTQQEDFGITPLEAMSLGKPVIAFRGGGVMETVIEGETGEFFDRQEVDALAKVLTEFHPARYDSVKCIRQAESFTEAIFLAKLDEVVKKVYHS